MTDNIETLTDEERQPCEVWTRLNLPRLNPWDSGSCYATACAAVSRTQFWAGSCGPPVGASRSNGQHSPYQSRIFIAALASACALCPHRVQI
jgi:hypothetical protein